MEKELKGSKTLDFITIRITHLHHKSIDRINKIYQVDFDEYMLDDRGSAK